MHGHHRFHLVTTLVLALIVPLAACAPRTAPPLPAAPAYPDLLFPQVPEDLRGTRAADRIDRGWRYLQNDDLRSAEREFNAALRRDGEFHPALTGIAYVAVARRDHGRALESFDAALRQSRAYVPALVGRAQSLLALERGGEALVALEAALAADPNLADVRRRIEVLRFRDFQEVVERAQKSAADSRFDEARVAYGRALELSPESAFLYRELGLLERRIGDADGALAHLRRAVELDPSDAVSLVALAELLEGRGDFAGAEAAYRRAAALDASPSLSAKIAAVAERAREARLPAEFRAIATSAQITRGELAALIGVRLEPLLRDVRPQQAVVTDIATHWAEPWITAVVRADVIEPFANHTFGPRAAVRRGDLATAVSRLLTLVAAGKPSLRARLAERPAIADMSPGHLNYAAAAAAVASGVMPLLPDNRFQVNRPVTGAEAAETIDRVRALAATP